MANINETVGWPGVPLIDAEDLVLGGPNGPSNKQAIALVSRVNKLKEDTEYLMDRVDRSVLYFPDYASASAATLPEGQEVKVKSDETRGGQESLYKKTSSGLEYVGPVTGREGVIATDSQYVNTRDYTREFLWDLPIEFPDYLAILASNGLTNATGYLYPGSYAFDEDAREIIIAYGLSVSVPMGTYMAVWDMDTENYKGYFRTETSISEGVEIVGSGANRRLFTAGRQDGNLLEWACPLSNQYQGGPLTLMASRALRIYNQFSRNPITGAWAFEQNEPSVGQLVDRATLLLTDKDFNPTGTLALDISQGSYVTPTSNAYSKYFPKRQGFALGLNCLATSHGASHDTGLQTQDPTFYQGCRVLNSRGEVLRDSITDPLAFKEVMYREVGGAKPTRIENEGCKFLRDGSLTALYIYRTRWSTVSERTTSGILICREFSAKGVDFSEGGVQTMKGDSLRYEVGVFPRANGGYINPVTGEKFTNLNEVCDYLHYTNRKQFSFYTSSYSLNDFDGLPLPAGIFVSITNLNGLSFHVTMRTAVDTNQTKEFYAWGGTVGGNNRTTARVQMPRVTRLVMDGGVTGIGGKLCRIYVPSYDNTGQDFVMLDLQSNEISANVMIGGGSVTGRGVSSIQMFTSDTHGEGIGTLRWVVNDVGAFRPGSDNAYQIGYVHYRVKELFAVSGTINTSDAREKTDPTKISDAMLDAWGDVHLVMFQWLHAVQQKGDSLARWHTGVIAQQVRDAFVLHGIMDADSTDSPWGGLCYDEWGASPEVLNEEGGVIETERVAGNRWGIRADQCLFLEAAYQRRRADRSDARVDALEGRLVVIEEKLNTVP